MVAFEIVEVPPQVAAVVRAVVPMGELPAFFGAAFGAVFEAAGRQGIGVVGAPFGYYVGMPSDTVDVAAGFPVSRALEPSGDVHTMTLPGGRVVRGVHVGSYDELGRTYGELMAWAEAEGHELADGMWESYLSDPDAEPDPATWRTEITWPVR